MFRSATFKLTLYYLLIIGVISIGFSTVLYQVAANDLANSLDHQTQRISDNFPVFSNSPYLHNGAEMALGKQHLLGRLVVFNLVVMVLAGFASYALARRTLRPIQDAHERQKRFTADVSHELRTPLTALKMESEVALMDPAASKKDLTHALQSNIEEAEKLTNLVTNLLILSQLDDAEGSKLQGQQSLPELIKVAIDQVTPLAKDRNIALKQTIEPGMKVTGEPATLTQLFVILLDNAVKYSPNDSSVDIIASAKQGLATVSVTDSGIGINKDDLGHVFERFYRADSARASQTSGGFGLGLSIAQMIANAHGASVTLVSQPGKGTTATVVIPLAVEKVKPVENQKKA